jgi:hypothetical protein
MARDDRPLSPDLQIYRPQLTSVLSGSAPLRCVKVMHIMCMLWFESFPWTGKASTFLQVRLSGTGLWSAICGISLLWTRVSGAGLCSLFSNFRFRGGETGSTVGRDQFDARSREVIAPCAALQIEGENGADRFCLRSHDFELLIDAAIAEGNGSADPQALALGGRNLVAHPLADDLALELGKGEQHINPAVRYICQPETLSKQIPVRFVTPNIQNAASG